MDAVKAADIDVMLDDRHRKVDAVQVYEVEGEPCAVSRSFGHAVVFDVHLGGLLGTRAECEHALAPCLPQQCFGESC